LDVRTPLPPLASFPSRSLTAIFIFSHADRTSRGSSSPSSSTVSSSCPCFALLLELPHAYCRWKNEIPFAPFAAAVQCNAIYENVYLLGTSLARPVIARGMIACAEKEGCE
jgi:hypothetical protein